MAYNSTITLALRYATQIGTPTASTKPTLVDATELWADATAETSAAFRAARLVDSGHTGLALQRAKMLEALYLGAHILLAKGSIGNAAESTSSRLLARFRELSADLIERREVWISEGASEEGTRTNPFVRSREVDDADPQWDWTPGTGDVPYSDTDLWPHTREDL